MINCPFSRPVYNERQDNYIKQSCETIQCACYDRDTLQCGLIPKDNQRLWEIMRVLKEIVVLLSKERNHKT